MSKREPEFKLHLRALRDEVPAHLRLRHLLKLAMPVTKLRALSVEEVPPRAAADDDDREGEIDWA
jgi:hypothetical protein